MNRFKASGTAVIAAAAMASLAACGGGSGGGGSSSQSASDSLTMALRSDEAPNGYDPLLYSTGQFYFFDPLYDALFVTGADGKAQPDLVSDFSNNADNTQTTLHLRDGVTFADGKKLDSSVVKANLDRRSDAKIAAYGQLAPGGASEITDVAAPDAQTVVITWKAPQATPESNLADTPGIIVGPDGIANPESLQTTPDGSGPYTLDAGKTTKASTYTLDKQAEGFNADQWSFDHIVFKVILDAQSLANAVISGQADIGGILDPTVIDQVQSRQSIVKNGGTIVGFPVFDKTGATAPAFADPNVRLALSYAIDRQTIVDTLHQGSKPTAQLFPSDAPGFDPGLNDTYAYAPDKAKQLLADAGYPNGFSFDMVYGGQPSEDLIAVQKQWADVGVTMNLVAATSTDQIFAAAQTTPLGFGQFSVGSNPAGFVAGVIYNGFANLQHAADPNIEGSLGAALGASGDAQKQALTALNAAITDDGWFIPVYEDYTYYGYNKDKVTEPKFAGANNWLVLSDLEPAS